MGNTWLLTLYKELRPLLCTQHGGRTARQLENREEAGVVAAPRTEAQRMAVQDDCAERPRGRLCGQRGPEAETGLLHADLL